jgi:transposase
MSNREGGNSDPLTSENLKPTHRAGRLEKFSESQKRELVQLCTANASQRRKPWALLAREAQFKISRNTLSQILEKSGYK